MPDQEKELLEMPTFTGIPGGRVTIKHKPVAGYRHTLGFITQDGEGMWLHLQCVKKSCKDAREEGCPHEVKLPINPQIYLSWKSNLE